MGPEAGLAKRRVALTARRCALAPARPPGAQRRAAPVLRGAPRASCPPRRPDNAVRHGRADREAFMQAARTLPASRALVDAGVLGSGPAPARHGPPRRR